MIESTGRKCKVYIQSTLLGFKTVFTCPVCSKPGLDDIEFDEDRSVRCTKCSMMYHHSCLNKKDADISDLVCNFCENICEI